MPRQRRQLAQSRLERETELARQHDRTEAVPLEVRRRQPHRPEIPGPTDMQPADRGRRRRQFRQHAQRTEGVQARRRQRQLAFVEPGRTQRRQGGFGQGDAIAASVQRTGQARADQARADDQDVQGLTHAPMIPGRRDGPVQALGRGHFR